MELDIDFNGTATQRLPFWRDILVANALDPPPLPSLFSVQVPGLLLPAEELSGDALIEFTAKHTIGAYTYYYPQMRRVLSAERLTPGERDMFEIAGDIFRRRALSPFGWTLFRLNTHHVFAEGTRRVFLNYVLDPRNIDMNSYRNMYRSSSFARLGGRIVYGKKAALYKLKYLRFTHELEQAPSNVSKKLTQFLRSTEVLRGAAHDEKQHTLETLITRRNNGEYIW